MRCSRLPIWVGYFIYFKFIVQKFINDYIFSSIKEAKKPCLRFLLSCFVQEAKGFYQSSLGYEVDFKDIINVSPNILAKN